MFFFFSCHLDIDEDEVYDNVKSIETNANTLRNFSDAWILFKEWEIFSGAALLCSCFFFIYAYWSDIGEKKSFITYPLYITMAAVFLIRFSNLKKPISFFRLTLDWFAKRRNNQIYWKNSFVQFFFFDCQQCASSYSLALSRFSLRSCLFLLATNFSFLCRLDSRALCPHRLCMCERMSIISFLTLFMLSFRFFSTHGRLMNVFFSLLFFSSFLQVYTYIYFLLVAAFHFVINKKKISLCEVNKCRLIVGESHRRKPVFFVPHLFRQ